MIEETWANNHVGVVTTDTHPAWGDPFVEQWRAFYKNVSEGTTPKTDPANFIKDLEPFVERARLMRDHWPATSWPHLFSIRVTVCEIGARRPPLHPLSDLKMRARRVPPRPWAVRRRAPQCGLSVSRSVGLRYRQRFGDHVELDRANLADEVPTAEPITSGLERNTRNQKSRLCQLQTHQTPWNEIIVTVTQR